MTWLRFSFSNLCVSPLTSIVNVLLMALGTASIVVLILAGSQISEVMARDARGIDLVLGATGSPVQLVLASVYHADLPPGNIAFEDATRWGEDPRVSAAVPVSIGDSFDGFRIVGTSQEFLSLYDGMTDAGRLWERPLEAVVGAAVARESGLAVGSKFEGAHGLEGGGQSHADESYEVVGVLASTGSVMDRLILTSLESVWLLHSPHGGSHEHDADASHASELESDADGRSGDHSDEIDHVDDHDDHDVHDNRDHHDEHNEETHETAHTTDGDDPDREITAMLMRYRTPLAAMTLPMAINAEGKLQAVAPATEVARVLQLIGAGLDGLAAFAWILVTTAALSVFAALYGSLHARRVDLAILRCLGATRSELLLSLLMEGFILSFVGVLLGIMSGHLAIELLSGWNSTTRDIGLTGWIWIAEETRLIVGLVAVGVVAAIIPAIQAYRTDVARVLSEA